MTNIDKDENQISAELNISKMALNSTFFYSLNKKQNWVNDLLIELNENTDSETPLTNLESTYLNIELEITKRFKPEYNEYVLIKGHLETKYITTCVRTLEEMTEMLKLSFNTCFLHERLESDENFSEQMEIYEKDEMYELYFYTKGLIPLKEMIHEVIYLNINQYPTKDETTPLHWSKQENDTKH